MSFMMSQVTDADGDGILASCPIYQENPLCVNTCALFSPEIEIIEDHEVVDYRYGKCSLSLGIGQRLTAIPYEQEQEIRKRRHYGEYRLGKDE